MKDSYYWVLFSKHHVRHSESFKDHPLISIPTSFYRIFEDAYKNTFIIIKIWSVKIVYQEGETLLECPGLCLPRWVHMVWHSTSSYTPSNPKFMLPARPVSFAVPTQAPKEHLKLPWTSNLLPRLLHPQLSYLQDNSSHPVAQAKNLGVMIYSSPDISRIELLLTASLVQAEMSPVIFCLDFCKSFLTGFPASNCKRKIFYLQHLPRKYQNGTPCWASNGSSQQKLMKVCELWVTPWARPLLDLTGDLFLSCEQRTSFIWHCSTWELFSNLWLAKPHEPPSHFLIFKTPWLFPTHWTFSLVGFPAWQVLYTLSFDFLVLFLEFWSSLL